jgi:hypothetical protein
MQYKNSEGIGHTLIWCAGGSGGSFFVADSGTTPMCAARRRLRVAASGCGRARGGGCARLWAGARLRVGAGGRAARRRFRGAAAAAAAAAYA